jgi:hypothetical protein
MTELPWLDENKKLTVGDYEGYDIYYVADRDPDYVRWMLKTLTMTNDEYTLCHHALQCREPL